MKILLYTFYKRWGLCSRVVWELMESMQKDDQDSSLRGAKRRSNLEIATPTSLARNDIILARYYINGLRGVSGLLKKIEEENYDYIVGLGDYRKDANKIRVESKFVNKYGRNEILEDGKDCYNADVGFLQEIVDENKPHPIPLLLGEGTTNGPCNRSAYLISELIERKSLKAKLLFLHIPRESVLDCTEKIIQNVIMKLNE